jgi:hypothetical protein
MTERYYVGSYWGLRRESAEECARRAEEFLKGIAQVDTVFARWFKQARSRKQALQRPLELDRASLHQYIERSIMRDDLRMPLEGGGFSVWLWNGESGERDLDLHFACGGSSEGVPNVCVLNPFYTALTESLLDSPALTEVLRCMAVAWEPDWGIVLSDVHRELLKPHHTKGVPYVGWVTYLSGHRGAVPPLPAPVRVESVEDRGTLIILTPERFTASNPEHVALATRVRELLERAGLLYPPRPGST